MPNLPKSSEGIVFVRGTGVDSSDKRECVNQPFCLLSGRSLSILKRDGVCGLEWDYGGDRFCYTFS